MCCFAKQGIGAWREIENEEYKEEGSGVRGERWEKGKKKKKEEMWGEETKLGGHLIWNKATKLEKII